MAHLPTIPLTFRLTLNWSPIVGVRPANVMHFFSLTGDEASLADALDNSWQNGMFGVVSQGTSVVEYEILPLDGVSTSSTFVPDPQNSEGLDGQASGEKAPGMAVCVAFRTAQRGPRKRGRIYLGPITESEFNGGDLVGVDTDVISQVWQDFNDAMVGTSDQWVHTVASYAGRVQTPITAYRCDNFPCTQRRRLVAARGV